MAIFCEQIFYLTRDRLFTLNETDSETQNSMLTFYPNITLYSQQNVKVRTRYVHVNNLG
jgi:type II restriction/modification system DNA methylase subunit YeeA